MILEVNNTFDERRMYFLKNREARDPEQSTDDTTNPESSLPGDLEKQKSPTNDKVPGKFTAAWQKDFHVSPFNSRKGGYSLSATDPFVNHLVNGNLKDSCGKVNNTITLSSSKDHPKLIARIFSSSKSIDPYLFEDWQALLFVLSWWWVGLVTFPRIVREAGRLFFVRKLHVWFRPEVLKDSIGRNETDDEKYASQYTLSVRTDADKPIEPSPPSSEPTSNPSPNHPTSQSPSNSSPASQPCPHQKHSPLALSPPNPQTRNSLLQPRPKEVPHKPPS